MVKAISVSPAREVELHLRRSSRVRVQQPAEVGGADDLARGGGVVLVGRFVAFGWEVVASGVRAEFVVPVLGDREDVIEVAFVDYGHAVQSFGLNCLDYPLDVRAEVRGTRGHLGDGDARLAEDFVEGGRVLYVVVSEEEVGWREVFVAKAVTFTAKSLTPSPSPGGRGEEEVGYASVIQEPLRLLRDPSGIGFAGGGREPESAGADGEEHEQGVEELHGEIASVDCRRGRAGLPILQWGTGRGARATVRYEGGRGRDDIGGEAVVVFGDRAGGVGLSGGVGDGVWGVRECRWKWDCRCW